MKRPLLLMLLSLLTFQLYAADYYWVGGGGNWSDLNHWRLGSSAGPIASIVPSAADNVFFNANSGFTTPSKTVTLNANGFCNNMTWSNVPNSPTFVTSNLAFKVQVSGSLVLSPTTTYTVVFAFKGATPANLTTNGRVLGEFGMDIDKPGSSLTVTDSLVQSTFTGTAGTNATILTSGTFNVAGKKVVVTIFSSRNDNVRTLEMTNAHFTAAYQYLVTGLNKTINAAGSFLDATGYLYTDGGTYNRVINSGGSGSNNIEINHTVFSSLTFLLAHPGSFVGIERNNTILDTLTFMGRGFMYQTNTVGYVRFGMGGTLTGTGNVIGKMECQGSLTVSGNVINTVDSLLLAPNHITQFRGTFNINDYLYVAGAPCDAFTEIKGDSVNGTVNFAAGAVVNISNVILTGVKATGPVTPIAVNGIDGGENAGFNITEPSLTGTTLYWVGGAGDWNDRNHWSYTSGGSGGACIPFINDNVVFNANSGLTGGGTVTTSSSSFCKDMNWETGVGTVTFTESGADVFKIYGSLVMRSSVTMNALMEFSGSGAASITTNGSTLGGLQFIILKTGSGSVTLTDNWSAASGSIVFNSGSLNMAGRTVSIHSLVSISGLARNLDVSNATFTLSYKWDVRGANKSMSSAGSRITSNAYFTTDGLNYPSVDLTYGTGPAVFSIMGTTFGQLTFTSNSTTSVAVISTGNTIRKLEFRGRGNIAGGGNNIDSLLLAGSRNYLFAGTNTIHKYLMAQATSCSGLTEMKGNATGTLSFGSAAEVHIANIYMQNMTATGSITPIAFNGADAGGNSGWTITSATGGARYWINGSGDWNDAAHWSTTSGGSGGACIPTVYDDIYFDANSGFTAASKTVTINNGNAYCRNINWTGALNSPVWSKAVSWTIEVWGDSVIINPNATFSVSPLTLKGANATFLKGGAPLGNFDIRIEKPGSSLTLLNNYNNSQTDFILIGGAFNAPGLTLNVASIDNAELANASSINISNAAVTTGLWRYSGNVAAHTLNAVNSSITTPRIIADGLGYNKVNVSGTVSVSAEIDNTIIDSLTFTSTNTVSAAGIKGSGNTINLVEYKGGGTLNGNNTIDTLIFFPGSTYTITSGTNTTITGAWYGSGTPCRPTEIVSSSTTNATITKNSGDVNFDYVRLRRITAAGAAAPFAAGSHSTDLGNNTNWNIAPYNGAAPIYGLGPDTAIAQTDFPYVLHTDGFFGAPSSQYTWNDNSTADSLEITGPGTYSVNVNFVDGCNISDEIVITLANLLPVTLTNFTAKEQECESHLSWKAEDAINFSHFVIEKSKDGRDFTDIGQIPYGRNVNKYSYTDRNVSNGTTYYRLRLVDIDGRSEYSPIATVNSMCHYKPIQVFPTVTRNSVKVVLPAVYEKAQLHIVNPWGQRAATPVQTTGLIRTVNLQQLPAGTYLLQVINGTEIRIFKIIKQ